MLTDYQIKAHDGDLRKGTPRRNPHPLFEVDATVLFYPRTRVCCVEGDTEVFSVDEFDRETLHGKLRERAVAMTMARVAADEATKRVDAPDGKLFAR